MTAKTRRGIRRLDANLNINHCGGSASAAYTQLSLTFLCDGFWFLNCTYCFQGFMNFGLGLWRFNNKARSSLAR